MTPVTPALTPGQVHDLILARLRAQPNLDVIDAAADQGTEPTYRLDPDGRVHMTAVLHIGAGVPDPTGETVDDRPTHHTITWQVTCVGGDSNRCLRAAGKVRDALTGQRLAPTTGITRELLEGPYTPAQETGPSPSRWVLPVLYRTSNG